MEKLDARLRSLLAHSTREAGASERTAFTPEGAAKSPAADAREPSIDTPTVDVFVEFTGEPEELNALGLENAVVVDHPDGYRLAAGQLPVHRVTEVAALPHVRRMERAGEITSELDTSRKTVGVVPLHNATPTPFRGQGVLIGVVDTEFDIRHPTLWTEGKAADGSPKPLTRVRSAWVQRRRKSEAGKGPERFPNFGREYSQAELQAVLDKGLTDPAIYDTGLLSRRDYMRKPGDPIVYDEMDETGHGTHVVGIAAGNGNGREPCADPGTYAGIAPDANIVLVSFAQEEKPAWTSTNLVQAVRYVFDCADRLEVPCVVNISMGDNLGPHDGKAGSEKELEALLKEKAGRVVVKSAGNEGEAGHHTFQSLAAKGEVTLKLELKKPYPADVILDIWYDQAQQLAVQVTSPAPHADPSRLVGPTDDPLIGWGSIPNETLTEQVKVDIVHDRLEGSGRRVLVTLHVPPKNDIIDVGDGDATDDPAVSGDHRVPGKPKDTFVDGTIRVGEWEVRVKNLSETDPASFHAWLQRGKDSPTFPGSQASADHTITSPGNARDVITVGAYADRGWFAKGELADFSSQGPVRGQDYHKPDLVAPGVKVVSALSDVTARTTMIANWCTVLYVGKSGTSMAAPHVAGVVALMLQANPNLTAEQVRKKLQDTADKNVDGGPVPNHQWGYGMLDGAAAVQAAGGPSVPTAAPSAPADASLALASTADATSGPAPRRTAAVAPETGLRRLQRELLSTPQGSVFAALASLHADEVRQLVRTHRRMAAVWRRNGGPTLVRAVMASLDDPDRPLPTEIGGVPAAERMGHILDGLARYASPALAADATRHRELIQSLAGTSPNQLLARLRAS